MTVLRNTREVASFVRSRRREAGMTQTDLAKKLGTTQDRISRMESGSPRVEAAFIFEVIAALGMVFSVEKAPEPDKGDEDPFLGLYDDSVID